MYVVYGPRYTVQRLAECVNRQIDYLLNTSRHLKGSLENPIENNDAHNGLLLWMHREAKMKRFVRKS